MAIRISEEKETAGAAQSSMAEQILALKPLIEIIEDEEDRAYFKGIVSLLIGKDIRLANIPKQRMYTFKLKAKRLYTLIYYSNIISLDYIRREIGEFLTDLGLSVSEDALFIKHGIGGFQKQEQRIKQEFIGVPSEMQVEEK